MEPTPFHMLPPPSSRTLDSLRCKNAMVKPIVMHAVRTLAMTLQCSSFDGEDSEQGFRHALMLIFGCTRRDVIDQV